MKKHKLNTDGDNADITLLKIAQSGLYEKQGRSMGGFLIGQKTQFSIVVQANKDFDNDIYIRWVCQCCSNDVCLNGSITNQMFFMGANGECVKCMKLGPMNKGQKRMITAVSDLTNVDDDILAKANSRVGIALDIFEVLEGTLEESDESQNIPKVNRDADNIKHLEATWSSCNDVKDLVFNTEDGSCEFQCAWEISDVLYELLHNDFWKNTNTQHIVTNVEEDLSCVIMDLVKMFMNVDEHEWHGSWKFDEQIIGGFCAASNIILFMGLANDKDDVLEDISFWENAWGCDVKMIITLIKPSNEVVQYFNENDYQFNYLIDNKNAGD